MKIATENIAVANTITKANKNLQGAKILQLIKMMLKALWTSNRKDQN